MQKSIIATLLASAVQTVVATNYNVNWYEASNDYYPRQSWHTFKQNPVNVNCFRLILKRMFQLPETDPSSYFQLARIHGDPGEQAYDHCERARGENGQETTMNGYCNHNTASFCTFHRPYIALFEKSCIEQCWKLVDEMTEKNAPQDMVEQYTQACQNFKLPYLDWANPDDSERIITEEISSETANIQETDGNWNQESNPLCSYSSQGSVGGHQMKTFRDADYVNVIEENRWYLRDQVANWFSPRYLQEDYPTFCTDGSAGFDSCELVHGSVHVYIGGNNGQMSSLGLAAFDPLFWLHHCNIDRLFALWQVAKSNGDIGFYSRAYFNQFGSYALAPNTWETGQTQMRPFRKDSNDDESYFTNSECLDHTRFGATYDSLWNENGSYKSREECLDWVHDSYGFGSGMGQGEFSNNQSPQKRGIDEGKEKKEHKEGGRKEHHKQDPKGKGKKPSGKNYGKGQKGPAKQEKGTLHYYPSKEDLAPHKSKFIDQEDSYRVYHATVTGKKNAVKCGSWTMYAFLGEPETSDYKNYKADKNYVGNHPIFTKRDGMDANFKCNIPLTNGVLNCLMSDRLEDTSKEKVKGFCEQNLKLRVVSTCDEDQSQYQNPEFYKQFKVDVNCGEWESVDDQPGSSRPKGGVDKLTELDLSKVFALVEGALDTVKDTLEGVTAGVADPLKGVSNIGSAL